MKKLLVILAAIGIPMMLWSQNPTHTLTIEYTKAQVTVKSTDNKWPSQTIVKSNDMVNIVSYQLEEGVTYNIAIKMNTSKINVNTYCEFSAWMRDGAVWSTSPELRLTMGKSDIHLTAVVTHRAVMPYSPGANWFDASTRVLYLDEIRDGVLSNAFTIAKNRYRFEWDDVVSLVVIGNLSTKYYITAFANGTMNSLLNLDLSQTSGMTRLQYGSTNTAYFLPKLEHVVFGPSLEYIEEKAFYGLNINAIDCYAVTPPSCAENAFGEMNVPKDQVVVRVPPESVELYKQAEGWKDFPNIQPLYETSSIAVKLPTDVPEGYYEDMTVELTNLRSQFVQNRRVLNKREIVYSGQIRGSEYQAVLKNAYGQVMGQTAPAELGETDITLTFGNLLRTKDVTLKVTDPDGKDVTDNVLGLWTDESDKALGHGYRLKAVAEGTKLNCKVTLTGELAKQYVTPGAMPHTVDGEGANLLTVALQPIQQMTLRGQVKDRNTGESIAEATVAVTQQSGNQSQSVTVTTDEEGRYELQGTNMAGELSVTAPGYLSKTVEFASPASDGALPAVELEPFNGIIVNTWLTYTEAAKEGAEGRVVENFDDSGDIVYQVYNQTKEAAVENFIVNDNALYLLSGADTGDELNITAVSRGNHFTSVSATCTIGKSGTGLVMLQLLQMGGLEAVVNKDESNTVICILYDADGRFVRSNVFRYATLSFANLAPGDYTLVSMTYNSLLRRVQLLSTFADMGLKEGTDYVKNTVHIEDGKIATVSVADVPVLDKEKIRFTDSGSYFIADRNTISIGQSVLIRSKLSFAEQYAGRTGNVEFLLDMPEGIDLVENSAIIGSTACNYRIEDGRYVFPVENMEDGIFRMCLLPKETGDFQIAGSVRFTLDGAQMVQPVGTVWVQAQGLTIKTPEFVNPTTLYVSGTAPLACQHVSIFDYDNVVGIAKVDGNGLWSVTIQFPKKYVGNHHAIKARATIGESGTTESEVVHAAFSDNHHIAKTVIMMPPHKKKPMVFNFYENGISAKSYTYVLQKYWTEHWQGLWMADLPYTTKFTFVALFDDLDQSKTDDVKIRVLASDGSSRTLKAKYDAEKQCYYASSKYPNSSKLPVSAYAYAEGEYSPESEEDDAAERKAQDKAMLKLKQDFLDAMFKKGDVEVVVDDGETLKLRYTVIGKEPLDFTTTAADYDAALAYTLENAPFVYTCEDGTFVFTYVNGTEEGVVMFLDVDKHTAKRTVITYAEMDNPDAVPDKKPVIPKKGPGISVHKQILLWVGAASAGTVGHYTMTAVAEKNYLLTIPHMNDMVKRMNRLSNKVQKKIDQLDNMLYSSCTKDGENKYAFTDDQFDRFNDRLQSFVTDCNRLLDQLDAAYDAYKVDLFRKGMFDLSTNAIDFLITKGALKKVSALEHTTEVVVRQKIWRDELRKEGLNRMGGFMADILATGPGGIPSLDQLISTDYERNYQDFLDNIDLRENSLMSALNNLKQEMKANQDCDDSNDDKKDDDKDDDDDDNSETYEDFSGHTSLYRRLGNSGRPPYPPQAKPLIDPQGYVYEAVPSNRVEGATATICYKDILLNDNGSAAGERDVMWDAENYEQVNPQTTGSDGMYQWDVPQGIWQVRVQKEGYEDNASEWLPVPPPQLDVNIPIVRARLPKVETAHAYEDAVTVKFDSYMLPALLTAEQITVKENGAAVEGVISLTDEEEAPDGAVYASQLRFVPATPFTATEVTLLISGQVKSYAGIEMDEPYEAVLPIERELKSLEAAKKVYVEYQGTGTIRVKGTPAAAAAGKTVTVTCLSGIIASATQTAVVLDANGEADVTIQGDLPGNEIITFTMEDPALTTSTLVKVVTELPLVIEAPEASVATETEVAKGTEITLTCKTEGAAIYYTLDGSSPLDSDTRILYDGTPVVINAETTLAAVAVIDGKGSSEVRVWHYTVSVETRTEEVSSGSMQVTPARVRDSFVVTSVEGVFSLRVYSMSGKLLLTLEHVRSGQRVDASALPAGIHLVVVNTPSASFTRRIVKY